MNVVILSGRWTKDPEYKQGNTNVAKGTLAVDRRKSDNQTADFISVVGFGKTADHIHQYYHKGMKANIRGRIQSGSYEGKNGKVYTTDVIIEEIEFGEPKGKQETPNEGFVNVPQDVDADLPFN